MSTSPQLELVISTNTTSNAGEDMGERETIVHTDGTAN